MGQVRVNLTLEKEVWQDFNSIVPQRKKSKVINELLKNEMKNIKREREQETLAKAFEEASVDRQRLASVREWEPLDKEGWD